jgi:hypothetical protein
MFIVVYTMTFDEEDILVYNFPLSLYESSSRLMLLTGIGSVITV